MLLMHYQPLTYIKVKTKEIYEDNNIYFLTPDCVMTYIHVRLYVKVQKTISAFIFTTI